MERGGPPGLLGEPAKCRAEVALLYASGDFRAAALQAITGVANHLVSPHDGFALAEQDWLNQLMVRSEEKFMEAVQARYEAADREEAAPLASDADAQSR